MTLTDAVPVWMFIVAWAHIAALVVFKKRAVPSEISMVCQ